MQGEGKEVHGAEKLKSHRRRASFGFNSSVYHDDCFNRLPVFVFAHLASRKLRNFSRQNGKQMRTRVRTFRRFYVFL